MSVDLPRGFRPLARLPEASRQLADDIGNGFDGQDKAGGNLLLAGLCIVLHGHDDAGACPRNADAANAGYVNIGHGQPLDKSGRFGVCHNMLTPDANAFPNAMQRKVADGNKRETARSGSNWDGTFWPHDAISFEMQGFVTSCIQNAAEPYKHFVSFEGCNLSGVVAGEAGTLSPLASLAARERAACLPSLCTGRAA